MRLPSVLLPTLVAFSLASAADKPRLLIQRIGPSASAIHIANADGTGERQLPAKSALDYNASLSPDGQWIAFTSEREGSADLYRCRIDGSSLEKLTDDPAYDDQASWSPNGERMVFVSTRRSGRTDIWLLDVARKELQASQRTLSPTFDQAGHRTGSGLPFPQIEAHRSNGIFLSGSTCIAPVFI
jgi:Tol biopolymer transport system component